jgi:hypothetical protein
MTGLRNRKVALVILDGGAPYLSSSAGVRCDALQ